MLQQISNLTVGRVMDLFLDRSAPRVQYRRDQISPYLWPNHARMPEGPRWDALRDGDFVDYRLKVHGLVANPVELSMTQIQAMGHQEQIMLHHCIQGWSGIAAWGGLPFAELIDLVRPAREAAWVMFYSFAAGGEGADRFYDSHSLKDLYHPQSLLALRDERATTAHPARSPVAAARGEPARIRTRQMDQRDRVRSPLP